MAIDKVLPRYLNKDDDDRLIKKVEMTDAQNVRVSSDEQGNGLVVKNAYGNEAVTLIDALPAGTNEVVGAIADEQAGEIFYFIWNSNNDHSIYRYTTALNTASQVCQDSVLEFSRDVVVQAEIVKNTNDDTLLYFNDGITAPKKINATKAIRNQYPAAFTTGTDDERLLFYTVAKQPPLTAPTFTFRRNPNIDTDIRNENFQFAYQYVYDDGEYSALSPYSELSVYPGQLKDGFIPENKRTYLNEIVVSVVPSIADVKQIRVFVRRGNEGTFYEVDTIDNSPTSTAQTVVFNSLKGLVPLGTLTTDKLYDNVPQIADSQTVAGNRLFYGGYTEGYDSIATSVETYQNLSDTPTQYSISVTAPSAYEKEFVIDYSSLPNTFIADATVLMNFFVDTGKLRVATNNPTGATVTQTFASYLLPAPLGALYRGASVVAGLTRNERRNYDCNYAAIVTAANTLLDDIALIPKVTYQDNTNDTNKKTKDKSIAVAYGGIKLLTSGVQVRITKEIPSGSSKADAISLIESELLKAYPMLVRPQFGEDGISGFDVSGWTPFTSESGSFQGKGTVSLSKVSLYSADAYKYEILFDNIELEVAEFYNGSGNKVDVIDNENNIKLRETSSPIRYQDFYVNGFGVSNAGSFVSESITGQSSFKSGATHQLGIVYFDDRGRTSTVQKIPSLTVSHLSERTGINALNGHATSVLRINHQPPSWANSWAPVYVGSGSVNSKIQYTTSDAFASKNKETTEGNASGNRNIYVSFRGLSGKKNSYVESYNPIIDYDFSEGDKLRICYTDKAGDVSDYIFNVKGYTYFDSNDKNNPILNPRNEGTIFSTTGKFLVLEDNPDALGFSYSDVAFGEHYWSANTVIEIYRESDADQSEIYYEMGTAYPIDNSATNKHGSQRPVGDLTNIDLNILSLVTLSGFGTVVPFATDKRVYSGDYVVETSNPNNVLRVVHSYSKPDGSSRPWRGMALLYGGSWSSGLHTTNVTNGDAAILELTQGDVYFRLRLLLGTTSGYTDFNGDEMFNLSAANNFNGIVRHIEDSNVSDFYKSINTSKGRPHLYMPNAARIKRSSSVTYSDPFSGSNNILGLSSFNLSLSNYYDFNKEHGSIKYLYGNDDIMYIIQERKVGQVAVSKNIIEFSDGTANITATRNVLSPINYYQGDYGVNGNPESVAAKNGSIFFCDVKSGKVIRLSRDGITPISEQLVDSYFKERFKTIIDNGGFKSIIGGIDVENKEYIVSTDAIYTSGVTITDGASEYVYEAQTDSSNTKVICPYVIDNAPIFKFGSDPRNFEDACDEWENSLDSIVFLDKLIDGDPVYVASSLAVGPTPISSNLYGVATNSNYDFFATITYDMVDGSFVFNNAYCTADASGSIGTAAIKLEAFTIAYNIDDKVWNTRYSYIPERIVSMNDTLFTFKSGRIYKHSDAANRNTYYGAGSPDNSIVEVVFNQNPSQVKFYKSLSLEGTNAWDAVISNSDQSTSISKASVTAGGVTYPYGDYEKLERGYFAEIPRDSSANSTSGGAITNLSGTSEVFGLGAVDSISGYNIVFTSDISYIPFPIGAALYKVSGSTLVSISNDVDSIVNNNTIACSNVVGGVSIGDEILVIANGAVEGDFIRDYYAKATLTNASATETELYAINAVYSESKLHNELGQ
jgi:hypothetical protein